MKQGHLAFLSAFGWLQLAAAGCCRSNSCLRAISGPLADGPQDCLSLLEAVTVTPDATTVTETVTEIPTQYASLVETDISTETVTSIVSTETLVRTIDTTVTAISTQRSITYITQPMYTVTVLHTLTTTLPATANGGIGARALLAIPTYAAADCQSWSKYVAACKCLGITQQTATASTPTVTVTASFTDGAVVISVPTTISSTETVVESVTATEATTETITATEKPNVGAFKVRSTDWQGLERMMFADVSTGVSGGLTWSSPSTSTSPSVANKYIWALDDDGFLMLAYNIPPYSFKYTAYVQTSSTDSSRWLQVLPAANADSAVKLGITQKIKGCVNPDTGELTLEVGGRRNKLYCGTQLWMSNGEGPELNPGTCVFMFPKIQAV
ncbi:hypothetical protein QBC44DRAFT_340679 [Cladorrhinum sp. PSN332]|nr:hypothetical protein QBC44DRAFT_340679 [Cladorrhinum sp. PSN332]